MLSLPIYLETPRNCRTTIDLSSRVSSPYGVGVSRNSGRISDPSPRVARVCGTGGRCEHGILQYGNQVSVVESVSRNSPARCLGSNEKGGDGTRAQGKLHGGTLRHLGWTGMR